MGKRRVLCILYCAKYSAWQVGDSVRFLNLKITNKKLAIFISVLTLYFGSVMMAVPFLHSFNIVSLIDSVLLLLAFGFGVSVLAFCLIELTYFSIKEIADIDNSNYVFACSICLGLLGSVWGGVMLILALIPHLAMFIGVLLLIFESGVYINLLAKHYGPILGENVSLFVKRHKSIVYCVVVGVLGLWLIL